MGSTGRLQGVDDVTRALTLLVRIAKDAKEAAELLERQEDKQVAVEIRFAAETVIETNKYERKTSRHHSQRQSSGSHD